jgi:predicted GNAT family N-acyltransferase
MIVLFFYYLVFGFRKWTGKYDEEKIKHNLEFF